MDIKFTALAFQVTLDQDDPDLIADLTINEWQKTDSAKWLLKHSKIATHRINTPDDMCLHYKIVATITPEKYTFWKLKYQ